VGLTKAAAKEVGFAGVRVNAVQPGIIRTALIESMKPEVLEARLAEVPLGRFGEPDEVASVILFLASDLSSYMTGTVLEIAGGRNI
jgi:3-oxoacyl-[acyl-carrier protein] reductase